MTNLRAKFVSAEPLPEGIYRPPCFLYAGDKYCGERTTFRVNLKIAYDGCCLHAPVCACGVYTEMNLCESHARQYEGKEAKDGIAV